MSYRDELTFYLVRCNPGFGDAEFAAVPELGSAERPTLIQDTFASVQKSLDRSQAMLSGFEGSNGTPEAIIPHLIAKGDHTWASQFLDENREFWTPPCPGMEGTAPVLTQSSAPWKAWLAAGAAGAAGYGIYELIKALS